MKQNLWIAGSVLAFAAAMPAQAQENTAVETENEIVVTAQKRVQNVQDVPISISVVGGEQMQESGGSQLADYAAYVPGLQVDNAGSPGRSTLSLRGVAPMGPSATVGIYLDDAPIGSSGIYNRGQTGTPHSSASLSERIEWRNTVCTSSTSSPSTSGTDR